MNKYELQGEIKSIGIAFLFWFLLGAHFAYLGKWGLQIIFWLTLGGLGIWWLVELFLISGRVATHNAPIYQQLEQIDKQEKSDDQARNLALINASKGEKNEK